ncbi:MAG: metallophosphoesterase [Bacilli bacterium]|nr:metallophosphoesterase [Bacilli bacterium]
MKVRMRLWVKITLTIITILVLLFVYGRFINTMGYKVHEYTINSNIPESFNGLKIVHISDINYKHSTSKEALKRIVKRINLINPDVIVFTGDLLNVHLTYTKEDIDDITNILREMNAKIGKFAVYGEEDIEFDDYEKILNNSNFILLDNDYQVLYNKSNEPIIIAGMSNDEKDINLPNINTYNILLTHKPDNINEIDYSNYDLILAGHSLGGYINIPGIKNLLLPNGAKKYYKDYYRLDNTRLYISNGLGTKYVRFRILNKPSFNFYRINKK